MTNLLERAQVDGTPLLDGDRATFVWHGAQPPSLAADFNNWGWAPGDSETRTTLGVFERSGKDTWTFTLHLPRDAYIEYALLREDGTRVPDSFNQRAIWNGVDGDNHYFGMPDYTPTPLIRRRSGVAQGIVTRHSVAGGYLVAGGKRAVHLYQPPTPDPAPLIVVFDGQDYLRRARLPIIVDNLIADGRIRPLALALVEHGRQARFLEYAGSEATLALLTSHILPLARKELHLTSAPGACGALGASMGGLMALHSGLRLPDIFAHVLSQSGAFGLEVAQREPLIFELARHQRSAQPRVWMDVGRYEGLLDPNRKMRETLTAAGCDVTYHEYPGGHNYTSWRDDLAAGLEALYGRVE